jgi:hypothetical protein
MEGNLVADEDLGNQLSIGAEEKAGCGTGSGVPVLSATYVLNSNEEQKPPFGIGDREQTTNKPLRMFVTGPAAGKCKHTIFTKIGSTCWKWVEF